MLETIRSLLVNVFGLIVEERSWRFNLESWQNLAIEHPHRPFSSPDGPLNQPETVILEAQTKGCLQLARRLDNRDPQAGALCLGLHHQGIPEFGGGSVNPSTIVARVNDQVFRSRHSVQYQAFFGRRLVKCQPRCHSITASECHLTLGQQLLNLPV